MKTNEKIKRVTAFITSVIFFASINTTSIAHATEFLSDNINSNMITKILSEVALANLSSADESDGAEQGTDVVNENTPEYEPRYMSLKINGESKPDPDQIIKSLFRFVKYEGEENGLMKISVLNNKDLYECLWYEKEFSNREAVFARSDSLIYKLENIAVVGDKYKVVITEYFDINDISTDEFSVVPKGSYHNVDNFYQYGTEFEVIPSKGWYVDERLSFSIKSKPEINIIEQSKFSSLIKIKNGDEEISATINKSSYTLDIVSVDKLNFFVNGEKISSKKYTWLDDKTIDIDFSVENNAGISITGVNIETDNGQKKNIANSSDGKSVKATLDMSALSNEYTNNSVYRLSAEVVPDSVNLITYYVGTDMVADRKDYKTTIKNGKGYAELPTLIYEDGKPKYVLDSYQYSNEDFIMVDTDTIY